MTVLSLCQTDQVWSRPQQVHLYWQAIPQNCHSFFNNGMWHSLTTQAQTASSHCGPLRALNILHPCFWENYCTYMNLRQMRAYGFMIWFAVCLMKSNGEPSREYTESRKVEAIYTPHIMWSGQHCAHSFYNWKEGRWITFFLLQLIIVRSSTWFEGQQARAYVIICVN